MWKKQELSVWNFHIRCNYYLQCILEVDDFDVGNNEILQNSQGFSNLLFVPKTGMQLKILSPPERISFLHIDGASENWMTHDKGVKNHIRLCHTLTDFIATGLQHSQIQLDQQLIIRSPFITHTIISTP